MFLEFIYTIIELIEFKKNIAMQKKALEEIKALKEERINPKYLDKKLYNDKKIIDCLRKEKQLFSVEKGYDIIKKER